MNGQFEGQSYVKDFVSTYEEAEKKIASYEDGLAIYQMKIILDW